jgi:protease-4
MSEMGPVDETENWEKRVIEKLARLALDEQRKSRNWGIFFKTLTFLYLFVLLFIAFGWLGGRETIPGDHTALVELNGVIAADTHANADVITQGLHDAFESKGTKGVILRINSPGGSPVQAGTINSEMHRLRQKYPQIPLYAVVEDICASGGYYVAVAADQIYVNRASIVGSIGVLMDGFGFTGTMEKLGVERRLLTAGDNKGFLDPFSPMNATQRDYAQRMLREIHQQFIDVVRQGRGKRLKESPDTYSGLVWTGQKSIELGLADALGSVEYVAREIIKAEKIIDFTPRENIAERFAKRFGAALSESLMRVVGSGSPVR